jgi:Flp pilus assembly protein TadG
MDMLSGHVHRRRGLAMIYAVIAMVCLCAFVSLAVDLGRVQLAKTELMRAADAAARAAATELSKGSNLTTIQNAAVNIANANKCDGSAIVLNTATDIEFGTWDPNAESFTALGTYTSGNAVRVTARRTNATSNAIPLAYGRVVGRATCDVRASAIAYIPPATPAITGLSKFDAYSGLYIASYNPNSVMLPTMYSGWHSNNGELGSNGTLDLGTSGNLWGDEYVGPSANVTSNGVLHGIKHTQAANNSNAHNSGDDTDDQSRRYLAHPNGERQCGLARRNVLLHLVHDGRRRQRDLHRCRDDPDERQCLHSRPLLPDPVQLQGAKSRVVSGFRNELHREQRLRHRRAVHRTQRKFHRERRSLFRRNDDLQKHRPRSRRSALRG